MPKPWDEGDLARKSQRTTATPVSHELRKGYGTVRSHKPDINMTRKTYGLYQDLSSAETQGAHTDDPSRWVLRFCLGLDLCIGSAHGALVYV